MTGFLPISEDKFLGTELVLSFLEERNEVLTIQFESNRGVIYTVKFEEFLCYRRYDEGMGLRTLDRIEKDCGLGKYMYVASRSEFIDWLVSEGYGKDDDVNMKHYVLMGLDEIIDIISIASPKITEAGTKLG